MSGNTRFGRKRKASVHDGPTADSDPALATLDTFRSLGWLVRHRVLWPGRPDDRIEHLVVGPPGVFVLVEESGSTDVDASAPGAWQPAADRALAAATDVAAALPGVPVTPVLCFRDAEPFTAIAGSVFLCTLGNVVEVLAKAPERINEAVLGAVRLEVNAGLRLQSDEPGDETLPRFHEWPPADDAAESGMAPVVPLHDGVDPEAERLAAERAEAERLAAERAEAERVAAERAEAERLAAERVAEAERLAAERAEAERLAAERAEAERLAAERAEAERVAAEKAEAERVAAEKAEAERAAAEKAEAERVAAERIAAERIAAEQAEAAKVAAEAEEARLAAEKHEADRLETERQRAQHHEGARLNAERLEQQKAARKEAERIEASAVTVERPAEPDAAEEARRRQLAEEAERAQRAVEAARERKARLAGPRSLADREELAVPPVEPAPTAPRKPDREVPAWLAFVLQERVVVTTVLAVVLVAALVVMHGPIGQLFTARAPARFGEEVNVGSTLYHPPLRLRAAVPTLVPGRDQVRVRLTVTDAGDRAWVLRLSQLRLQDRMGVSYPARPGRLPGARVFAGRTAVATGGTVTGYLLFDVPRDRPVKRLRLELGPTGATGDSGDPVVWFNRS